jgi:hypothetical protein
MSTSKVKFIHSGMAGAPVLSGTAGSLIAVLDACLVDGWGMATVDSLVISGGIATITRAAGHPFEPDCVSEISGAVLTSGSINGQRKVLSTTSTSYTVDATGIADQTATGTIQHKVAPLGWTRPFATAANVAVYRLDAADGTGMYLRVDDSGTRNARVTGYETMTDLSSGTGAFAPAGGGGFWAKSSSPDSTVRSWTLVGDDRTFVMRSLSIAGQNVTQGFGDMISRKPVDPYRCALHASNFDAASNSNTEWDMCSVAGASSTTSDRLTIARGVSGLGSAVSGQRLTPIGGAYAATSNYSGSSSYVSVMDYPNRADNALLIGLIPVRESGGIRGSLRGVYYSQQNISGSFSNHAVLTGVDILPGRRLRAMASFQGFYFVDVTGPWAV